MTPTTSRKEDVRQACRDYTDKLIKWKVKSLSWTFNNGFTVILRDRKRSR